MARIGFLLTATQWRDRRQYHRQGPSLLAHGHTVVYIAVLPDTALDYPYEAVPLSASQRKFARPTGGLNLLRTIARARLDVLQVCSIELLPLGIVAKVLKLTKVVYDCREDMPSAMRDHKPHFPVPVRIALSAMTRWLEEVADRLFDGLVTADPATAQRHGRMPEANKVVFFNCAPPAHFPSDGPALAERAYDVAVVGSMSEKTGVLDVIRAVALLRDQGLRVKVVAAGHPLGTTESTMRNLINELRLTEAFNYFGWVDHLEVPKLLYNTRIGLVSLRDFTKFRRNIASKAFEFMAARMVCVATDLPPQRLFLDHGRNAMLYPPGDVGALADVLSSLLGDLETAQRLADQARRDFLRKWNLDYVKIHYSNLYDRITRDAQAQLASKAY